MSRKDYVALAKAMGLAMALADNIGQEMGAAYAVEMLVQVLDADNPRFDDGKFREAVQAARSVERDRLGLPVLLEVL